MIKRLFYIFKQKLYVIKNKNNPCQGMVYMFHNVNEEYGTYSISKDNFNNFINWALENKNVVDINQLTREKDNNNVVITFDDAFESVYQNAYPILKEKNIPYYIFICNEFIDKDGFLKTNMIKEMLESSKCIIGSHSMKHILHRFEKEANNYIEESKKALEMKFNTSIDTFAFPYGSMYACSDENIEIAKMNYKNICLTYPLSYNENYDYIPRINMNDKVFKKEII